MSENSDIGDDPKFNMAVRAKNVMWLTEPHSSVVLKQWSSLKYNIVWITMWWSLTDYVVFVMIRNPKWPPPKKHTLFSEIKEANWRQTVHRWSLDGHIQSWHLCGLEINAWQKGNYWEMVDGFPSETPWSIEKKLDLKALLMVVC